MPKGQDTTTKFKVDISDLKSAMQEASRSVRLANSEFKAATAGMDDWGKSADGLGAKVKQLETVLSAQKSQLSSLETQYQMVAEEQGENSKGAQELAIKINNQKAAIGKTESQLKTYSQKLSECKTGTDDFAQESQDAVAPLDKLKNTINEQEEKLDDLKDKYAAVVIEQGKNSSEAKTLATEIETLSSDLKNNVGILSDAESAADDFDKSLGDLKDSAESSSGGFSVLKGAIADLVADGIRACIDALKDLATEAESAYNSFQAQTGASAAEMGAFKEQIDDLYKSGFGESLDDIASSMAEIKQQTGEVDPTKLRDMTENALTLRDTFGFDVKESIRAANMLMQQFGMDGDAAFGLIAKGAQDGLNKNDDLLDTINEYAPYYKAQGYEAGEFYNSLKNGVDAGTFSVDKLGDAMKEFGVRSKDTSTTTTDGLKALGFSAEASAEEIDKTKTEIADLEKKLQYATLEQQNFNEKTNDLTRLKNADKIQEYSEKLEDAKKNLENMTDATGNSGESIEELQKQFAAGGDESRKATKKVLKALYEMDDEVEQNAAGVALFGTMWEDLGKDGVKALMDTNGELGDTKQTLDDIKKVKYDDIKSQWTVLGRTVKTELLAPMAEKLLPTVEKFVTYCIDNMDDILPIIKNIGIALGTAFAVKKIADFATSLSGLFTMITANPVGLLITALAGLAGAYVATQKAQDDHIKSVWGLSEEEQKLIDKNAEVVESFQNMKQARDESMEDIENESSYYQGLADELGNIVDENGKVKEGYEDRAAFIANELGKYTGLEIELIDGVVQKYDGLKSKIDEVIERKKAEAVLSAYEADYQKAIKERDTALAQYTETLKKAEDAEKDLKTAKDNLAKTQETMTDLLSRGIDPGQAYSDLLVKQQKAVDAAQGAYDELSGSLSETEGALVGYKATIENYQGLEEAILSGDADAVEAATTRATNSFISAEIGTKKSLENQVKNAQKNYENMAKAVEEGSPLVTKEMVASAKEMVSASEAELEKFNDKAPKLAQDGAKKYSETLGKDGSVLASVTSKQMTQSAYNQLVNAPFDQAANANVKKYSDSMGASGNALLPATAYNMANMTMTEFLNADFSGAGTGAGTDIDTGLGSVTEKMKKTAKSQAEMVNQSYKSVNHTGAGKQGGTQYNTGIESTRTIIDGTAKSLSKDTNTGLKSIDHTGAGKENLNEYINGMKSKKTTVGNEAVNLSSTTKSNLGKYNMTGTGEAAGSQYATGIGNKKDSAKRKGESLAESGKSGASSVDATETGGNFADGFGSGISSRAGYGGSIWNIAWNLAGDALSALSKRIQEGSPSRLTRKSGGFFAQGFADGIASQTKNVIKQVRKMADAAIDEINTAEAPVIIPTIKTAKQTINRSVQQHGKEQTVASGITGSPVINNYYTFQQTNNSPQPLNRLEIYRQTQNQMRQLREVNG